MPYGERCVCPKRCVGVVNGEGGILNDWVVGAFGVCDTICGGGTQTRTVECQDCNGNVLADGECAGPKPAETQACNTDPCCLNDWVVGPYGECDTICGGGTQIRTVECQDCNGNVLADGECAGPKPATSQSCNTQQCPRDCVVSAWGPWSACDTTCGGGYQYRTRTIVQPPLFGGMDCPDLVDSMACNTDPCCIEQIIPIQAGLVAFAPFSSARSDHVRLMISSAHSHRSIMNSVSP